MNPDTRVVVCCYQGDGHQVIEALEFYLQHGCPVTVMSPADSPVVVDYPGVDNVHLGKAAYIGQDSLDRQALHMAACLEYPESHFLLHDSDSVVLGSKIPDYLYAEPNVVWSNQVFDDIPEHQTTFEANWPHVAFQPPYFLSRETIGKMLAVKDDPRVQASPVMPFIDYYMVQLTMVAGLEWRRFKDCVSCPIALDLRKKDIPPHHYDTIKMGFRIALQAVQKGAIILHSVKNVTAIRSLANVHAAYVKGTPYHEPQETPAPRVRSGTPPAHPVRRGRVSGPPAQKA